MARMTHGQEGPDDQDDMRGTMSSKPSPGYDPYWTFDLVLKGIIDMMGKDEGGHLDTDSEIKYEMPEETMEEH